MMDWGSVVAWVLKHWYLPVIGVMVAIIGWKMLELKAARATAELATARYEEAQRINEQNTRKMSEIRRRAAEDRAATAKELEQTKVRSVKVDAVKKEMRDAPGSTDPAGPFLDQLGERLRALDAPNAN
jgi:flagellar biosynthesis/type III secretory pathway M-ring protein FliF/YscJ